MDYNIEKARKSYLELNNSFKPTLTYTFKRGGFYSAFNNMILSMAYCLKNHIKFRIHSKCYVYFQNKGWNKVFLPFIPESNNKFFNYVNKDYPPIQYSYKQRIRTILHHSYEMITGNNLMDSVFWQARTYWFAREKFDIPELGLSGDLHDICKYLIEITYQFNEEYTNKIQELIHTIQLPPSYIGMHIRRGDKILEREFKDIDTYFKIASSISDIKDVFILTDDYKVITDIKERYKNWNIYTLTFPYEHGFSLKQSTSNPETMDREMVKVIASLEVLKSSEAFIGTVSTNPGMFLGMIMDTDKVHYIDSTDWVIL